MHIWLVILLAVLASQETDQQHGKPLRLDRWTTAKAGIQAETPGTSIRVSKGPGWIRTTDEYLDFVVHMRFRVLTTDADGAVLLRAWQREAGGWPSTGYRLAIAGPAVKRRAPLVTGFSAKTQLVSGGPEATVPPGDVGVWRELTVLCRHDRVTVTVDGREVGVVEGGEPQAGAIGIEARKGVIEFDDIWLLEDTGVGLLYRGPQGPLAAPPAPISFKPSALTLPQVVREVQPRYTSVALAAGIEGVVVLEVIVLPDANVGDVRLVRPLNHELDVEAVAAARRWRFKPGALAGVAVPVLVTLELTFKLRGRL